MEHRGAVLVCQEIFCVENWWLAMRLEEEGGSVEDLLKINPFPGQVEDRLWCNPGT